VTDIPDDVVELSARAIEATTDYSGDIARRQARAALEAAKWGETVSVLRNCFALACDYNLDERFARSEIAKQVRALLSTIGHHKP
jgi:hypothetical protein